MHDVATTIARPVKNCVTKVVRILGPYVCSNHVTRIFVAVVARIAKNIQSLMTRCEHRRSDSSGGPTVSIGDCDCPLAIMANYGLTLDQLTYLMEQQQPTPWTDPRGYCGDASNNCADPVCIPLPR